MAQRRIRVGVVGADGHPDRWGARGHIPAVLALPEVELVAVCTAHQETARAAQRRTGARLAFWDYRQLAQSPEVDLVTVAVRVAMHHPIAVAVLEAGKHLFCEWPLALGTAQAVELHRLAQERGIRHAVGTQARFSPGLMYAKEMVEQGYVGRPLIFAATHFLSTMVQETPSHREWTLQAEGGVGALMVSCGHALDVVRWLLGEVEEVSGRVETLVKERRLSDTGRAVQATAPDTVAFLARLTGGVTGTVHVSSLCPAGSGFRLELYGTEGRLLVETPHMVQYSPARLSGSRLGSPFQALPVPPRLTEVPGLAPESHAFHVAQLLRRFMEAITRGDAFHPDFGDGVRLHRTLEAVAHSGKTGRWEAVG